MIISNHGTVVLRSCLERLYSEDLSHLSPFTYRAQARFTCGGGIGRTVILTESLTGGREAMCQLAESPPKATQKRWCWPDSDREA